MGAGRNAFFGAISYVIKNERMIVMKKLISMITMCAVLGVAVLYYPSVKVYAATSDLQLMARAVNGEARGEPYTGQVAVAAVILNRVKHSSFPNTVAGVIYQPGAFTAVSD